MSKELLTMKFMHFLEAVILFFCAGIVIDIVLSGMQTPDTLIVMLSLFIGIIGAFGVIRWATNLFNRIKKSNNQKEIKE